MKGVILAGGYGTRLRPLTNVVNKHLLPVYDRPMISYPLETLKKSGIDEIMIVSESAHVGQFSNFLKGGEGYDVRLAYAAQNGAGGIAEALSLAKDFAGSDPLAVILGDNIFEDTFSADVSAFTKGAKIFIKPVSDPQRFGVPVFSGDRITAVEEKPEHPKSKFAVVGLYLFDNTVFDIITKLKPSARGELEVTDALNAYAKRGALAHALLAGHWADAGTFESLLATSNWVANRSGGIHEV